MYQPPTSKRPVASVPPHHTPHDDGCPCEAEITHQTRHPFHMGEVTTTTSPRTTTTHLPLWNIPAPTTGLGHTMPTRIQHQSTFRGKPRSSSEDEHPAHSSTPLSDLATTCPHRMTPPPEWPLPQLCENASRPRPAPIFPSPCLSCATSPRTWTPGSSLGNALPPRTHYLSTFPPHEQTTWSPHYTFSYLPNLTQGRLLMQEHSPSFTRSFPIPTNRHHQQMAPSPPPATTHGRRHTQGIHRGHSTCASLQHLPAHPEAFTAAQVGLPILAKDG